MTYRSESLGRMAVFLLPSLKLKQPCSRGISFEMVIHDFLMSAYGGYTAAAGNIFGYWRDKAGREHYGEHREFKVGFLGKERIPELAKFLAGIAREMGEECVYLEPGEAAPLIFPVRS